MTSPLEIYTHLVNTEAFLPPIGEVDLRKSIFSINPRKAAGADNIRICDIQQNFDALNKVLPFILKGVLVTADIPEELKTAGVRPLFKGAAKASRNSVF